MNGSITVSICCLTYNHEKYIRQCLDGLIMQKTEFDFEILVHDDASSDATQSIINEYVVAYPNLIKVSSINSIYPLVSDSRTL